MTVVLRLLPILFIATLYCSGQTHYYVGTSGSNSNAGTSWASSWRDIKYAILNSSGSNIIIHVGPGTYSEQNVVINKALVLSGQPCAVLDGSGIGTYMAAVKITASNVTVEGFEITGYRKGIIAGNGSSLSNIVIRNNHIHHTKNYNVTTYPEGYPAEGIHIGFQSENYLGPQGEPKGTSYATFNGLVITGNNIHHTWDAVALRFAESSSQNQPMLIEWNRLWENQFDAISLDCVRQLEIRGNEIVDNRGSGIVMVSTGDYPGNPAQAGSHGPYTAITDGSLAPKNIRIASNIMSGNGYYGNHTWTNWIDNAVTVTGAWPEYITITTNSITGNHTGITNLTAKDVNAEYNWWGTSYGPRDPVGIFEVSTENCGATSTVLMKNTLPPGTLGDNVSELVDYCPWLEQSNDITIDPDPLDITGDHDGQGTLCVRYLGAKRLFGYSVKLVFDASLLRVSSVVSGDLFGAVSEYNLFWQATAPGEVTVHSARLAPNDGVAGPGTMFCVAFEALKDCGQSTVGVLPLKFRDKDNQPVFGPISAVGQVRVDLLPPMISDQLIKNVTVQPVTGSHGYAKNGDHLQLVATIEDGCACTSTLNVTADLTAIGGGSDAAPTSWVGGQATWDIQEAELNPANSPVGPPVAENEITIYAEDVLGNEAEAGESIIADNTPPTAGTELKANPKHKKVHLYWTAGTDDFLYGYQLRYNGWGDYPFYASAAPAYPLADYSTGTLIPGYVIETPGPGFAPPAVYDHLIDARDILYYRLFTYDWALNRSTNTAGSIERSTNYFLGDFASQVEVSPGVYDYHLPTQDGYVNYYDLLPFSIDYWWTDATPLMRTEAQYRYDVGPTVANEHTYLLGGHRFGIPVPDGQVEFEDLMIFSMNYGMADVTPTAKTGNGMLADMLGVGITTVRDGRDLLVRVGVNNDGTALKGASVSLRFDPSVVAVKDVTMGDMFGAASFFKHRVTGGTVQCDAALLGTGLTTQSSGDVAWVRFEVLRDGDAGLLLGAVRLRDGENREVSPQVQRTGVPPAGFSLEQNYPNPFNPTTVIRYGVPEKAPVTIEIYSALGTKVATLVSTTLEAGMYETVWNAAGIPSGLYYYTMRAGSFIATRTLSLMK